MIGLVDMVGGVASEPRTVGIGGAAESRFRLHGTAAVGWRVVVARGSLAVVAQQRLRQGTRCLVRGQEVPSPEGDPRGEISLDPEAGGELLLVAW